MIERCDFKNQWMTDICGEKVLNDGGEPYCIYHGTRRFLVRATDLYSEDENPPPPARGGGNWTEDDLLLLVEMIEDGLKIDDIAIALERSRNAVYNKIWALARKGLDAE